LFRQNKFDLTILFAKWTKIDAPEIWHNFWAGEQLWFQDVWWRARDCLLWHSTQNGISLENGGKVRQDKETGLFQVR
jgi:hypothetical protein